MSLLAQQRKGGDYYSSGTIAAGVITLVKLSLGWRKPGPLLRPDTFGNARPMAHDNGMRNHEYPPPPLARPSFFIANGLGFGFDKAMPNMLTNMAATTCTYISCSVQPGAMMNLCYRVFDGRRSANHIPRCLISLAAHCF